MIDKKEDLIDLNKLVVGSGDVKGLKAEYLLQIDSMQANVEPHYYFILDFLKKPGHFGFGMSGEGGRVEKLKDLYSAGITSAYWGAQEQRKGLQQDKAMNMLATVGKMVKDTFQIVREIRVIKERLTFYEGSKKGDTSADIALKGTWIDMVEGGAKSPASVYGLASQVGFAILPDLFFRVAPKKSEDIDKACEKVKKDFGLNPKIIEVLKRKLKQYMVWKEKTYQELTTREKFVIKYLRQHYNTIKLYINWIRPYLRNVRELQMKGDTTDAALAKSFDTSKIELELLGVKKSYSITTEDGFEISHDFQKYFPAVWVSIRFTAIPMMAYQQEYQRGAIHSGTTEIAFRGVVITEEQLKEYKDQQEREDMEMLNSVFESMEALGEEFYKYLEEAGEKMEVKEGVIGERQTAFGPFGEVFKGFKELFGAFIPRGKKTDEGKQVLSKAQEKGEKSIAGKDASKKAFIIYDVFKKAHGMMAW